MLLGTETQTYEDLIRHAAVSVLQRHTSVPTIGDKEMLHRYEPAASLQNLLKSCEHVFFFREFITPVLLAALLLARTQLSNKKEQLWLLVEHEIQGLMARWELLRLTRSCCWDITAVVQTVRVQSAGARWTTRLCTAHCVSLCVRYVVGACAYGRDDSFLLHSAGQGQDGLCLGTAADGDLQLARCNAQAIDRSAAGRRYRQAAQAQALGGEHNLYSLFMQCSSICARCLRRPLSWPRSPRLQVGEVGVFCRCTC